jgi:hypothetical protein
LSCADWADNPELNIADFFISLEIYFLNLQQLAQAALCTLFTLWATTLTFYSLPTSRRIKRLFDPARIKANL